MRTPQQTARPWSANMSAIPSNSSHNYLYVAGMCRCSIALALLLIACSGPSKKPDENKYKPDRARAITVKRLYVSEGRKSGTVDTTTTGDTVTIKIHVVENGRGPKIDATIHLAADHTIASLSADGQHTMGTKVDESFSREGKAATWKSEEERGE